MLCRAVVSEKSTLLAAFVCEEEVPKLVMDELPDMTRWCSLQTLKADKPTRITDNQFVRLRGMMREQQQQQWKDIQSTLSKATDRAETAIDAILGGKLDVAIPKVVPLDVHYETDEQIASSVVSRVDVSDDTGYADSRVATMTTTLLHVNEQVLYLYVYGGAEDLQWTRDTARLWAQQLLSANTTTAAIAMRAPAMPAQRTSDAVAPSTSTRRDRQRNESEDLIVWLAVGAIASVVVAVIVRLRSR